MAGPCRPPGSGGGISAGVMAGGRRSPSRQRAGTGPVREHPDPARLPRQFIQRFLTSGSRVRCRRLHGRPGGRSGFPAPENRHQPEGFSSPVATSLSAGCAERRARGCDCGRQDREPAPVGLWSVPFGGSSGGVFAAGRWQRRSGAEGGAGAGGELKDCENTEGSSPG